MLILSMYRVILHIFFWVCIAGIYPTWAQKPDPALVERIGIDQRLGEQVPLDLVFTNELGVQVELSQLISDKPVVLTLVYYECPMLCNQVLNSLLRALNVLTFDIGTEFEVVTVSVDPGETPELASQKKGGVFKELSGRQCSFRLAFPNG